MNLMTFQQLRTVLPGLQKSIERTIDGRPFHSEQLEHSKRNQSACPCGHLVDSIACDFCDDEESGPETLHDGGTQQDVTAHYPATILHETPSSYNLPAQPDGCSDATAGDAKPAPVEAYIGIHTPLGVIIRRTSQTCIRPA